ncbi:MAG: hypothetical protein LIR46_02900 [Bacteroidota bacterium]|nr:hypothetical protein [Bacteroidota bacterium]
MTTLFDIGDEIELTMTGVVKEFSMKKPNDDCYVIYLKGKEGDSDTAIFLDTKTLLTCNAHKKAKNIAEEAINAISRSVYERWDNSYDT